MLAVIVPVAVAHELASGEAQDARLEVCVPVRVWSATWYDAVQILSK